MKRKDLTGLRFGHLVVQKMLYDYNQTHQKRKRTYAECLCDCGNTKIIEVSKLKRNNISCGCLTSYYRSLHNRTNEIGKTFHYLTIKDIDYTVRPSVALCQCKCGNIITVAKADVVSGHTQSCGCLQKAMASKANTKDFSNYVSDYGVIIKDRAYKKNNVWYWNCVCPKCHKLFVSLPAKILENHTTSCGCKKKSSKELYIEHYLQKLNVKYQTQYRFKDCKFKYTLPFDFAVFVNDKLVLIEYDGEQHFKNTEYYNRKDSFELRQKRDQIKTQYCIDNNIKLIRLNYTQSLQDIETIIKYHIENP